MNLIRPIPLGILFCFLSVALGAFGAHGLKTRVSADLIQIWNTGAQYQFYHGLALILLGLWAHAFQKSDAGPLLCFTLGILLFSGSLYILTLTGVKAWGMVTPLGGLLFLAGWVLWLIRAL